MDKIAKFLAKLSPGERLILLGILEDISVLNLAHLDVKKLVGEKDLFRVRKGKIRIVYRHNTDGVAIINIDYRGGVYKGL